VIDNEAHFSVITPRPATTTSPQDVPVTQQGQNISEIAQTLSDLELMAAAQRDTKFFSEVYRRYFRRIYAYCLRNVSNPVEAEDLASQVFVQSFRSLAQYRGGSVGSWLFRIAYGTVVNYYRQSRVVVAIDDKLHEISSDIPEPLEVIMRDEQRARLKLVLNQLTDDERQLLALKIEGGLSSSEIADTLGLKAGAIRTRLHRIIKRIRQLYEQMEHS
jgi:RNA polymerase sigma-70 factor (ECF subfamily)